MIEPDADGKVTIRYDHFLSLNKEVLRLGDGWREAANEVKRLKREVERLEQEVEVLRAKVIKARQSLDKHGVVPQDCKEAYAALAPDWS